MIDLRSHMSNRHSQCGEDGILREIIRRLAIEDIWCCEFGAWDGRHASNTFNLVTTKQARSVMIEGDPIKYQALLATQSSWPNIIPINRYVSYDINDPDHLDNILAGTPIPRDFDILSIDIDGDDLVTWESISAYHPKIVVIEINPRIEPGIFQRHHEVKYDPTHEADLNSFSSTVEVGQSKGYDLICHTSCNLIFSRQDLRIPLGVEQIYIDDPVSLFDWKWVKKARKAARKRQSGQEEQAKPLVGN